MWPVFIINIAIGIALACDYEIFSFEGIYDSYYKEIDSGKIMTKELFKKVIIDG